MKLGRYDPYNIAIRSIRLHITNIPGRFQQRYFVERKSAVGAIKTERHINTTCKDRSQKRVGLHDWNRKGSLLFIYAVVKHHNQRDKK